MTTWEQRLGREAARLIMEAEGGATTEHAPRVAIIGARDPGPFLTIRTWCACGQWEGTERAYDVREYQGEGARDGLTDARAWARHRAEVRQ